MGWGGLHEHLTVERDGFDDAQGHQSDLPATYRCKVQGPVFVDEHGAEPKQVLHGLAAISVDMRAHALHHLA